MPSTVTGFLGAPPGSGPYLSPRFRPNKKSNAGKFYRRRNASLAEDFDNYLMNDELPESADFDLSDIISPEYAEFGFVKAYKTRLRKRGLDAKQLFCVNRHVMSDSPRTCLSSLPKLKKQFLVQQSCERESEDVSNDTSPLDGHLQFEVKNFRNLDENDAQATTETKEKQSAPSKLVTRLQELEEDILIPGYIVRKKNHGRPLGNITTSSHLCELLKDVQTDTKKRPSIFYRTEIN